ncbi:MAG: hypothetical protein IPJ32_12610, partial [Sphingobacteriaceae bacterium]|nr:hypothetical protein [Sphingobacteriaceae bacterium]
MITIFDLENVCFGRYYCHRKMRGAGIGKLPFDGIVLVAKRKSTSFRGQVLDWNEPAIRFYKKY